MLIQHAFTSNDITSGVTMVDVSELPWPGYTFGVATSSTTANVERSFEALAAELGVERLSILTVQQVHGDGVVVVGDAPVDPSTTADALVTDNPTWILGVKLADCCGVLLRDTQTGAIAAVHSGWRGTAQNIVASTIAAMQTTYGTDPAHLDVWLSPCASGARYEVGADVQGVLGKHCTVIPGRESTWLFDNHSALVDQLLAEHVKQTSIYVDSSCTIAEPRWHSHRRDRERAGRMLAFIGRRPMHRKSVVK